MPTDSNLWHKVGCLWRLRICWIISTNVSTELFQIHPFSTILLLLLLLLVLNLMQWRRWVHESHLVPPVLTVLAERRNILQHQIPRELLYSLPQACRQFADRESNWYMALIGWASGYRRTCRVSEHGTVQWCVGCSSLDTRMGQFTTLMVLRVWDSKRWAR